MLEALGDTELSHKASGQIFDRTLPIGQPVSTQRAALVLTLTFAQPTDKGQFFSLFPFVLDSHLLWYFDRTLAQAFSFLGFDRFCFVVPSPVRC